MTRKFKINIIISVIRALMLSVTLCISSTLASFNIQSSMFTRYVRDFWNIQLYNKVSFIYSLLIFFSIASVLCLYNISLKNTFVNRDKRSVKFFFILKNPLFWIEFAVIAAFFMAFSMLTPTVFLINGFLNDFSNFALKTLLSILLTLISFLILYYLAYHSTLSWWESQTKEKGAPSVLKTVILFVVQYVVTATLWVICGVAVSIVTPMLFTTYKVIGAFKIPLLIIIFILAITFATYRYAIIIYSRRKFIKKLRRVCIENGFTFSLHAHPYRSAFYPDEGYHLLLKKEEKIISCRLISAPNKKTPLYLFENGYTTYEKNRIVYKHYISEKYFFDADGDTKKIIIVCPCRGKIFIKNKTEEHLVDVGDRVMEYRLYHASSFINAIERDCI